MVSAFKKILFTFCAFLCLQTVYGQVDINFSIRPPFTPFISDYTNPERLDDISVSVFNQSGQKLRLKFKLSLKNAAAGIQISLKESVVPKAPFELNENEFKFVVLEEVSQLYGKLSQNSFNIQGADIQNLVLDGTIPDGNYEVCLQAFDFDAPGYSKPLSGNSPFGCFSFSVNYTDPPTDIRFNNNLLQYNFGGEVPKLGINGALQQNYNIQFTSSPFNTGSDYEYELSIYNSDEFDPRSIGSARILDALSSLTPIVRKTSNLPFFTIDQGDPELDFFKDYFLIIRVIDNNGLTLFKNKGYSALKAFRMMNLEPIVFPAPEITTKNCGKTVTKEGEIFFFQVDNKLSYLEQKANSGFIHTRYKAIRLNENVAEPADIFSSNMGEVMIDTIFRFNVNSSLRDIFDTDERFGINAVNSKKKWIVGIQNMPNPNQEFNRVAFENEGKSEQCVIKFDLSTQFKSPNPLELTLDYPQNNDTLPFQYPPIVVKSNNLSTNSQVIFTQFNSILEPIESRKYLKLTFDAATNVDLNGLGLDSGLTQVSKVLNRSVDYALMGDDAMALSELEKAKELLKTLKNRSSVQLGYAINCRNIPLGNGSKGKYALVRNLMNFEGSMQLLGVESMLEIPNFRNFIYVQPYKNNILWTGKVGIYDKRFSRDMTLKDYEKKFKSNSFTKEELKLYMLSEGYKSYSGKFHVGMGTPILQTFGGRKMEPGTIRFSFLPSLQPKKLLPTPDKNEAWTDFEKLSVAQQWNLEISRTKDFSKLDTVIRKKIAKLYTLAQGSNEIIRDLYSNVTVSIPLNDTGTYYWRVAWSNPTLSADATEKEKEYYRQVNNLLAENEILGGFIDSDSIFLIAQNYRFSAVDSFRIAKTPVIAGPVKVNPPKFELIYPLPGDTIPFYYPPTVIKMNNPDTSYGFALTRFNSPLEPFECLTYFLLDTNLAVTKILKDLSNDTLKKQASELLAELARLELMGETDQAALTQINQHIDRYFEMTDKKTTLNFFKTQRDDILPLGNSPEGKKKLIRRVLNANAEQQLLGRSSNGVQFTEMRLKELVSLQPYREVEWAADMAFYSPHTAGNIGVDSFEQLFLNNQFKEMATLPPALTSGIISMQNKYNVGMKQPVITQPLNGKEVQKNKIAITFKPSQNPVKLFPESDNNEAWKNFKDLSVAQQWNIEISNTPTFDSIIFVQSKSIIEKYSLPGSQERVMNDLYNPRAELINFPLKGKFYYRITWSNPSAFDSTKPEHKSYFGNLGSFLTLASETSIDEGEIMKTASDLGKRTNYIIGQTDSFMAVDTVIITVRDTAKCGEICTYNGVITQIPSISIAANDLVDVGLFKMKIKEIRFSGNDATGEGLIDCYLFPAPIAVEFSGVRFNEDKRLMSGTVTAKYQKSDLMTAVTGATHTGNNLFDKIKDNILGGAIGGIQKEKEVYKLINDPLTTAIDLLTHSEITMPFGLSKDVNNFPSTIAFTDIYFNPTVATFNAASVLDLDLNLLVDEINYSDGQEEDAIANHEAYHLYVGFGATGMCLNPRGLTDIALGGALDLIGSVTIPITDSIIFKLIGKSEANSTETATRMVWDCNGFKHLAVKASVTIGRALMIPMVDGEESEELVTATGTAEITSWNDFLISLQFDRSFRLPYLPDFTFTASNMTLDLSTRVNPVGIAFPEDFKGEKGVAWKGVYLNEIGVSLPNYLTKGLEDRSNLMARNMLIDGSGITGSLNVENILTIDEGKLAGAKFSIDVLSLSIIHNVPGAVSLSGVIGNPIFPITTTLPYTLMITYSIPNDSLCFSMSVNSTGTHEMPAWFARLNVTAGSSIQILGDPRNPETFAILTNLNGTIAIGAEEIAGLKNVNFGNLPFEGLKVKTYFSNLTSPEISLEKLGGLDMNRVIAENQTPSGSGAPPSTPISPDPSQKAGNMPIEIQDMAFNFFEGKCNFESPDLPAGIRVGIKFKVVVNIADASTGNGIGGSCNLGVYATTSNVVDLWSYSLAGLQVDTIRINAVLSGVVTVEGGIAFNANHPVFGNGIVGFVKATFVQNIGVGLTGMFGEKDGMRYWMIGASLNMPPIPIDFSANVIYANYFSGEAWYHMKRTPGKERTGLFEIGKSPSGATFEPNSNELFGFGAEIGLQGPPGGSPIYGKVGAFAALGTNGGLTSLSLQGDLWFIDAEMHKAPLVMNGTIFIDISKARFTGNLTALVNAGEGAVRGRTPKVLAGKTFYIAGSVDMLVDFPLEEWYIKLGDPFKKNGKLGFGFYAGNTELFQAGGYFMVGNKLPQQLPPIDNGLKTGLEQSGIIVPVERDPSTNTTGFAVLMGVDAKVPEKRVELGTFYAGISVQFAMDGVLSPMDFKCSSPTRNGMGGWYARGKAYAAINGALGIKLDLPFFQGDIIAAELNAGAILTAGLMNPYVFAGQFSASFNVLGGLIEGSQPFDFQVAEDPTCMPPLPPYRGSFNQIVADISPAPNEQNVLIGAQPVIALNFRLNTPTTFNYQVPSVDQKGDPIIVKASKTIRATCPKSNVTFVSRVIPNATKVDSVKFNLNILNDGLDIKLTPLNWLKADSFQTFTAKIVMEELLSNGTWAPIIRANNKPWDTTVTRTFKTESSPQFHEMYISYSSPLEGSQCVKTGDIGNYGKIVLVQGPASRFFQSNATVLHKDIYYGQFIDINFPDDTINVPLTFVDNEIRFPLISSLTTQRIYHFRLVTEKERLPIDPNDPRLADVLIASNPQRSGSGSKDVSQGVVDKIAGDLSKGTSGSNYRNTQVSEDQINQMAQDRIFRQRTAENVFDQRTIIYGFPFKLSKYRTLTAKMNQLVLIDSIVDFKNDSMLISFQTDEGFEEYEVFPTAYQLPGGALGFFPPAVITGNAITSANKCSWQKDYYPDEILYHNATFHTVIAAINNAGISVPSQLLVNTSTNHTSVNSTVFKNNNYIAGPLSTTSRMGSYVRYQYFNQASFLAMNPRLRFPEVEFFGENNLAKESEFDEMLRRNGREPHNNPPPPPPPQPPAIGTRLYLNYVQFLYITNQYVQARNKATFLKNNYINNTRFVSTQMRAKINSFVNDGLELPGANDYFMIYLRKGSSSVNTEYRFRHYWEKAIVEAILNANSSGNFVASTFEVVK